MSISKSYFSRIVRVAQVHACAADIRRIYVSTDMFVINLMWLKWNANKCLLDTDLTGNSHIFLPCDCDYLYTLAIQRTVYNCWRLVNLCWHDPTLGFKHRRENHENSNPLVFYLQDECSTNWATSPAAYICSTLNCDSAVTVVPGENCYLLNPCF